MENNYSDLLGTHLFASGFRLIGFFKVELIIYRGTVIKRYPANRHSLKAIKRYCCLWWAAQKASSLDSEFISARKAKNDHFEGSVGKVPQKLARRWGISLRDNTNESKLKVTGTSETKEPIAN